MSLRDLHNTIDTRQALRLMGVSPDSLPDELSVTLDKRDYLFVIQRMAETQGAGRDDAKRVFTRIIHALRGGAGQ